MSGARAAQGKILLVMDADLSHPADRTKDLVAPLFADTADLVVGSRYVKAGRHPAGQCGGALSREQVRCLAIRSLACTIPCAASSQSVVRGCWNSRRKPAVSKLFSRQWCAPAERRAHAKFPSSFVNAYTENRKCRWVLHSDFFSAGCARFSSISSTACRRANEAQT